MTIQTKAEDGLRQLNALVLRSGNSTANRRVLAAAKEDLRSIIAEATPEPMTLAEDRCTDQELAAVEKLWGSFDAVSPSRWAWTADGPFGGPGYKISVLSTDRYEGSTVRAELGHNSRTGPTFHLYREGDHTITTLEYSLPADFPEANAWRLPWQMKQSEDYAVALPEGVALQAELIYGEITYNLFWREQWSQKIGPGDHREEIEVFHSIDPVKGFFRVTLDGVQSPLFRGQTLAKDENGKPIESHLRRGLYQATTNPGATIVIGSTKVTAAGA